MNYCLSRRSSSLGAVCFWCSADYMQLPFGDRAALAYICGGTKPECMCVIIIRSRTHHFVCFTEMIIKVPIGCRYAESMRADAHDNLTRKFRVNELLVNFGWAKHDQSAVLHNLSHGRARATSVRAVVRSWTQQRAAKSHSMIYILHCRVCLWLSAKSRE